MIISGRQLEMQQLLPELKLQAAAQPKYDFSDVERVRGRVSRLGRAFKDAGYWAQAEESIEIRDLSFQGRDGNQIPVGLYRLSNAVTPSPAIVFFQGGSFMIGDLDFEHEARAADSRLGDVVGI